MHKWRRRGRRPGRRTQRFYFFKKVPKLAAEVMAARGLPLDVTTLQQWEQGRHQPRGLVGKVVIGFQILRTRRCTGRASYGSRTWRRFAGCEPRTVCGN